MFRSTICCRAVLALAALGCLYLAGACEASETSDLCTNYQCYFNAQCVLDAELQPSCECPSVCIQVFDPVCGTDNRTYSNRCYLDVESCNQQRFIGVRHKGNCRRRRPNPKAN